MVRKQTQTKKTVVPFGERLVLNRFILSLLDYSDFKELASHLKLVDNEGWDEERVTFYHRQLVSGACEKISRDTLLQYDHNIVRHTLRINEKRVEPIKWKYFQYLSLLFTEIYLDRYFTNPERLLRDLNEFSAACQAAEDAMADVSPYTADDLRKLAIWSATGSGKTLLMHMNLLQFLHYQQKHGEKPLNRLILLTPNEDLSRQHERDFRESGIDCQLFQKDQILGYLLGHLVVTIIDIHKLKDEHGEKTVAVDSFETNNLVLVDEGHRGSSGEEWKAKRDRICQDGFSFEYSATFGQAIAGNRSLEEEYAKCILFDYSYKYFYKDGYGKEFHILNLADDSQEAVREMYLTACVLSFYQQMKVYSEHERELRVFQVERPLFVFVGGSVNAVRTSGGRLVSDVTDILQFLAGVVRDEARFVSIINRLLSPAPELLDKKGREIFNNQFLYLLEKGLSGETLYRDLLQTVFNAPHAGAKLHVVNLKGVDSEIALRFGEGEPFGVINVGDTAKLSTLCESYPDLMETEDQPFSESLFHRLNRPESKVTMLFGSRKFNEGWNSWRVSTMGLMNIGRKEGSLIIQLFGRGVRLKGYTSCLKRSDFINEGDLHIPSYLKWLETLHVFGVKADYMEHFREFLEAEGVQTEKQTASVTVRTTYDYERRQVRLKTLRIQDNKDFKKQGPRPVLEALPAAAGLPLVVVNWYPRIESLLSSTPGQKAGARPDELNEDRLTGKHLAFVDLDAVYFQLQQYKYERGWNTLGLNREKIKQLLESHDWYRLYIPADELRFDEFRKVSMWQDIVEVLLKKYCEQYYFYCKKAWEKDYLIFRDLTEADANFVKEFTIIYDAGDSRRAFELDRLHKQLESNEALSGDTLALDFRVFTFGPHLYHPLIYVKGSEMNVSPAPLNAGEYQFVIDLQAYYSGYPDYFADKEMYLLRNRSRGRGIGFFEGGNFYPDFILWILHEGKQYMTFVDPKGLSYHSRDDKKIQFYRTIKDLEPKDKSVVLNSIIVSFTPYDALSHWGDRKANKEELENCHIFFQKDDQDTYIRSMLGRIIP